jgi:hypothetical protein
MRKTWSLLLIVVIVALALFGCQDERKSDPTQLDAAAREAERQTQQALQAPRATNTPWPTPWPATATRTPARTPSSPTPWPTKDRSDATNEPTDNDVVQGQWLLASFTDESGQARRLEEFIGRAVVVQFVSASCAICIEQQQILLQTIQERYESGLLTDTVFMMLGVIPGETPGLIRSTFQSQLPDNWATVDLVESEDTPSDIIYGIASSDLLAALENAFGPNVLLPEAALMIIIETDGLAHPFAEGIVDFTTLRDAITAYGNPPAE